MFATVGAIRFEEWPRDYDDAFLIAPQGLSGWFGGLEMRRDETERPLSHGLFDAPGYLPARVISISGTIVAPSPGLLEEKLDQLSGLLADGGMGRLTVQGGSRATWADVRLAACEIDRYTTAREADYQVQFWAPDPRRYGKMREFVGASVVPYHEGTLPAIPEVLVTGEFPQGYTIGYGSAAFIVTAPLTVGQTHRIDMRTGWVFRGATQLVGAVAAAEVLHVPPGMPNMTMTLGGSGGSGSMTVRVLDTYA